MTSGEPAGTGSTISGGIFYGPVLQGRDIQATFQLPAAAPVALAQLPPEVAGFADRDDELAVLSGLLDPAGTEGPVVVSAVAGLAGVGMPAAAYHWDRYDPEVDGEGSPYGLPAAIPGAYWP